MVNIRVFLKISKFSKIVYQGKILCAWSRKILVHIRSVKKPLLKIIIKNN